MQNAFAISQGASIYSVHPSLDDCFIKAGERGLQVTRSGLNSAIFEGTGGLFNPAGSIRPVQIEPSDIRPGYHMLAGAEDGLDENHAQAAADYFQSEDWMYA
jgi:hypothetical protein